MKAHNIFFNIILLALPLLAGCETSPADKQKKELTAIRFHQEASAYDSEGKQVPILRAHPVTVNIDPDPFADERDLEAAEVVDSMGGFAIVLQFNRHGTWMLENVTRSDPGHRIAIFCSFDSENRWLAAPLIARPIANGALTFTPDATREEADRIVLGLNNVAAAIKKNSK